MLSLLLTGLASSLGARAAYPLTTPTAALDAPPLFLSPLPSSPPAPQIKRTLNLPKLSAPPPDFLASMEAYVAEAPRPAMAHDGEAPPPAKVRAARRLAAPRAWAEPHLRLHPLP